MNSSLLKVLKIGIVNDSDTVAIDRLYQLRPGYLVEATKLTCEFLGYSCDLRVASSSAYGTIKNNTWTGLLGDISESVYNTSLPQFSPFPERLNDFCFPNFYFYYPVSYVLRKQEPTISSRITSITHSFKKEVWFLMVAIIGVFTLMVVGAARFHNHENHSPFVIDCINIYLWLFSYLTRRGAYINDRGIRLIQLILVIWGFCAMVFTSTYCGSLLSSLLRSETPILFKNFETMVKCVVEGRCYMAVDPSNMFLMSNFAHSDNTSDAYRLYLALEKKGQKIEVGSVSEGIDLVRSSKEKHVFSLIFDYAGNARNHHKNDDKLMIFSGIMYDSVTFPFRKSDQLCKKFDQMLQQLTEMGFLQCLETKYHGNNNNKEFAREINSFLVLSLVEMSGSFFLLVICLSVAFVFFTLEKMAEYFYE